MGAAGGEFGDLLRGVPEAAAEHVGGPGVKFDDDVVVALAFQHGEAAAEVLVEVKAAELLEFVGDKDRAADAGEDEAAEVGAGFVVGDQVPEIFVAGEVVGMDMAEFGALFAGLAVFETHGAVMLQGASDGFEAFEVGDFGGEGAEGEDALEVLEGVAFFGVKLAGEFLKSHLEWLMERRGLILLDGFMGGEQGEHFGLGNGRDAGEFVHGLGIVVTVPPAVVFDGGVPVDFHPFDVAFDGFLRHFEVFGQSEGVGKFLGADGLMDFEQALVGVAAERCGG